MIPLLAHLLRGPVEAIAAPEIGADGKLPEWIHVVPFGEWLGHQSGPLRIGKDQVQAILGNFSRDGIDLVVDYEHQTMHTEENGQPAPAAAWLDRFELRDNGVWAHVREWTPRAAEFLKNREYRYLSPVIAHDAKDRKTGKRVGMKLLNVALTNFPFLAGDLEPVLNKEPTMNSLLAFLVALLTLPEGATEDDAKAAITVVKDQRDAALEALGLGAEATVDDIKAAGGGGSSEDESEAAMTAAREALGLAKDAKPEDVTAAIAALRGEASLGAVVCRERSWKAGALPEDAEQVLVSELKHSGYVAMEEFVRVVGERDQQVSAMTAAQLVEHALKTGKIPPSLKAWAEQQATKDIEGLRTFIAKAKPVVPLRSQVGHRAPDKSVGAGEQGLSDTDLAVCRQLQIDPKDYAKTKAKTDQADAI